MPDPCGFSHPVPTTPKLGLAWETRANGTACQNSKKWAHRFRCKVKAAVTSFGILVTGVLCSSLEWEMGSSSFSKGLHTNFMLKGKPMPGSKLLWSQAVFVGVLNS